MGAEEREHSDDGSTRDGDHADGDEEVKMFRQSLVITYNDNIIALSTLII